MRLFRHLALMALFLLLAACSQTQLGGRQSAAGVTGSAGPSGAVDASDLLQRCDKPLGVVVLAEEPGLASVMASANLSSPLPVIKLLAMQSGCFQVVDRGAAMRTIVQERMLDRNGETQAGSNMGAGQLVSPDMAVTVNVLWSGKTGGGAAGAGFAALPGPFGLIGVVAGSMSERSVQSMLTLTNVRTGVNIVAAEGTATTRDFSLFSALGGAGVGGGGLGGLGAYGSTPQGKVVAASLVDAYNKIVISARNMKLPGVSDMSGTAGGKAGDLVVKGNIVLREEPDDKSAAVGRVPAGTKVVWTGKARKGWKEIAFGDLAGWVHAGSVREE
jgi:curli biogenesis system outer membrane secretion channel CsgG